MIALYVFLSIGFLLALLFLALSYYSYRVTFYSDRTVKRDPYKGIDKRGYAPYEARVREVIDALLAIPYEKVEIISRDGTRLSARYYHAADGAPLGIHFHGYRGTPLRDFAFSSIEHKKRPYNLLLIDQRAHGDSEGKVISFGIRERFDVLDWVNYSVDRFGSGVKIFLYGISMGAATVLMAAGEDMPKNVCGVIADCPYSSPLSIIVKVAVEKGLPAFIVKPITVVGARLFGGFSITESSPVEAVKRAKVPILLIHGDADSFVPYYMSEEILAANPSIIFKRIEGAEHAVAYFTDTEGYLAAIDSFIDENL